MILALFQRSFFLFILFAAPSFLTHASLHGSEGDSIPLPSQRMHSMELALSVINDCGFISPVDQAHISNAAHFLQQTHSDEIVKNLMYLAIQYAHEIRPNGKEATAYQTAFFLSRSGNLLNQHDQSSLSCIELAFHALSDNAPYASLEDQDYYLNAFFWISIHSKNNPLQMQNIARLSCQFMRSDHTKEECDSIIGYVFNFITDNDSVSALKDLGDAVESAKQNQSWEIIPYLNGFIEGYNTIQRNSLNFPFLFPQFSPLTLGLEES